MTRPRNRPVGGRYFLALDDDDRPFGIALARSGLDTAGADRIVECVAMPRVRVRQTAGGWTGDFYAVFVNGTQVGEAMFDDAARDFARDLRRALRKGGGK